MRFRVFEISPETRKPLRSVHEGVEIEYPEETFMNAAERVAWRKWSEANEGKSKTAE